MSSNAVSLGEMTREQIIQQMIGINLPHEDDFLIVKETLSRMGLANVKEQRLYQSCHIFHKRQMYYLVHFKEMLAMDGLDVTLSQEDIARRNTIANQLAEWGLITLINPEQTKYPVLDKKNQLYILPHNQKAEWKLIAKYSMGKKVKNHE